VSAVRHRQHVSADVVHLLDVEISFLVLEEPDAELIEFLNDFEAAFGVFVDRRLITDAVIRDGDFLGVLLRRRVTGG